MPVTALLLVAVLLLMLVSATSADDGLFGYWKLRSDARDYSGRHHNAHQHGVQFAEDAAVFDGRRSHLSIDGLDLGKGDFSVSLWVHTDERLSDVVGDLVSKLDPATRKGFSLSVVNHAGMTSSQSNYRHLQFGIHDGDRGDGTWTDCGHPGNASFVTAMTVWRGDLYVGTFEPGADEAGHLYRYAGGTDWVDCGSPDRANSVMSLAVYEGQLYAGTACYNARGSLLPASPNTNPGGHVYRFRGKDDWEDCGRLGEAKDVYAMCVFDGALYANPMYSPGVFRYDGGQTWTPCGIPGDQRSMSLAVYNGHLYNSGNGSAGVWRYEGGDQWAYCGKQAEETQTYSFAIHEGRMLVGTWPSGSVFRYGVAARFTTPGREWESLGQLGEEKEVMGLALYNGELYAGTLPLAQVYRYRAPGDWLCTGQLDTTADVPYRRAWTMAAFGGKLYCGTLPSGHVYSYQSGLCVSDDHELPAGWHHVAAVRDDRQLRLYVDGKQVAACKGHDRFDLTNDGPLLIGFGSHDYFNGRMREVRLYGRGLGAAEVRKLAAMNAP